ncbi:hypothetical protein BV898_08329 [Hypsibius exemplaris]|uniref:Secreted protein n=1 Tax=Hypsibius exemplaris TaxID=2072580 RepID=A0A1W0WQS3_HYPEX|nr:hypothetical protein BV898_08329 [Hypsibius exemplaris]
MADSLSLEVVCLGVVAVAGQQCGTPAIAPSLSRCNSRTLMSLLRGELRRQKPGDRIIGGTMAQAHSWSRGTATTKTR